jgi:hypothetical protein
MFLHQNHGAGGGNGSVMVGMFVCLCLASKKPYKREFFVSARTDLSVELLRVLGPPRIASYLPPFESRNHDDFFLYLSPFSKYHFHRSEYHIRGEYTASSMLDWVCQLSHGVIHTIFHLSMLFCFVHCANITDGYWPPLILICHTHQPLPWR